MNKLAVLACVFLATPDTFGVQDGPDGTSEWMDTAQQLADKGQHAEALALYLRCFDEGRSDPEFAGVRVSFLLGYMKSLGSDYPPAMDALRERRDTARTQFEKTGEGQAHTMALMELVALNDALGARAENVAMYDKLRAENADERLLEIVGRRIAEELTARGEPPQKSSRAERTIKNPEFLQPYWQPQVDPKATLLQKRWDKIKMEVARISVDNGMRFYRSMESWRGLGRNFASVIEGDAAEDIDVGSKGALHILGNLSAAIKVSGQSEVVIGGDLTKTGSIEASGITRIYVGGNVAGEIHDTGSSVIVIARDLTGLIKTGTPSTDILVAGDFKGKIEPTSVSSLLYLTVEGTMTSASLQEVAAFGWTEFRASIAKSDLAVGLYPKLNSRPSAGWVVHSTMP